MKFFQTYLGKLCLLFAVLLPVSRPAVFAQSNAGPGQQRISGRVVSATDDTSLPGATVRIKGGANSGENGINTDANGTFILVVPDADSVTLTVQSLGYQTREIAIGLPLGAPLVIRLEAAVSQLNEVVVSTGYQQIPQERATGSFTFIDNELLNRKPGTNILERLDGVANSVLFDKRDPENPRIQIRGLSTLSDEIAKPLIVVDNFPYEGDIAALNPNDVESITILKDAAASSIWGARAGNGVIVITTKKGKFSQPFRVNASANVTIAEKPNLFSIPEIPAGDFIDLEKFLFEQGAYDSQINNSRYPPLTAAVEILLKERNGEISAQEADQQLNVLRNRDVRNDFLKYLYRPAVNQQYALDLSGGAEKIRYYVSAGYDKNLATLRGNGYERISLRSANTFKPLEDLQIDLGIGYTQSLNKQNSPGGYSSTAYRMGRNQRLPLYARLADNEDNPLPLYLDYRKHFIDTVGNGQLLDWRYYPLNELNSNDLTTRLRTLTTDVGVNYRIFESLDVSLQYRYQNAVSNFRDYNSLATFYTRDLVNRYTNLEKQTDDGRYPVPKDGILDLINDRVESHQGRAQVGYDGYWQEKHRFTVIGGAEVREHRTNVDRSRTYGYNDRLNTVRIDYVNRYPLFTGGSSYVQYLNDFSGLVNRYVSLYGNAGYTYLDRYTLTLSARKDASNIFGVKTNQKGRPFWSAGMAWQLSREPFYHSTFLPFLKLRMTTGYNGNSVPQGSALTTIRYRPATQQPETNLPYATLGSLPNVSLRWEKIRTFNAAVDFGFRGDRIRGSIEYFEKKSTDVYGREKLDLTTGENSINKNSANMEGHGWDIQLNTSNIRTGNVRWETNLIFNYSIYKVTKYLLDQNTDGFISDGSLIIPIEGQHPYLVVSYPWAGLDPETGDPMGYLDGEVSKDYAQLMNNPLTSQVLHGPGLAPVFGNLLNAFTWKGIELSLNITYRFGYYIRKPALNYQSLFQTGQGNEDYLERWKQRGDERITNIPSQIYPADGYRDGFYESSSATVEPGDHIRLDDIRLSYSLNARTLTKLPFRRATLFAYTNNLNFLIWKKTGELDDPEYPGGLLPPFTMALGLRVEL